MSNAGVQLISDRIAGRDKSPKDKAWKRALSILWIIENVKREL